MSLLVLFCSCVVVFFSPFSIAITSLGEEWANLSAFRTFVRFVLVWVCRFPLPLCVWEGLRFMIVALLGLFSYLFFILSHMCLFCHCLFLRSPCFGASGRLCFMIVAFPGYFHLYFSILPLAELQLVFPMIFLWILARISQSTNSEGSDQTVWMYRVISFNSALFAFCTKDKILHSLSRFG